MYWLADIAILILCLIMIIIGWKKGFSNTAGEIVCVLIALGGAGACAFLLVEYPFTKWGWIETLSDSLYGVLGGESSLFEMLNMTGTEIATLLAKVVYGLVSFIICYIFTTLLMWLVRKLLKLCRKFIAFRFIDNILGVVVDLALGLVLVCIFMSIVYLLPGVFKVTTEAFHAAKLSNFIFGLIEEVLGSMGL